MLDDFAHHASAATFRGAIHRVGGHIDYYHVECFSILAHAVTGAGIDFGVVGFGVTFAEILVTACRLSVEKHNCVAGYCLLDIRARAIGACVPVVIHHNFVANGKIVEECLAGATTHKAEVIITEGACICRAIFLHLFHHHFHVFICSPFCTIGKLAIHLSVCFHSVEITGGSKERIEHCNLVLAGNHVHLVDFGRTGCGSNSSFPLHRLDPEFFVGVDRHNTGNLPLPEPLVGGFVGVCDNFTVAQIGTERCSFHIC